MTNFGFHIEHMLALSEPITPRHTCEFCGKTIVQIGDDLYRSNEHPSEGVDRILCDKAHERRHQPAAPEQTPSTEVPFWTGDLL